MPSDPTKHDRATILEDLPFYLARAGLAFRRFGDRTLRSLGLPPQAPGLASVLHALSEEDDCRVSRLIERTHLPNGTLTGLLDRLEREGCIHREPSAEDRRARRVRLTPKGHRLCVKLRERHDRVMALFGEALTEKETAQLKRLLARLTAAMRRFDGDRRRSPRRESTQSQPKTHARPS